MDRANIQTILPLSGPQQAILLHGYHAEDHDPGLVQVKFSVKGRVDDAVMEAAWQDVIARHDALRATIQIPKSQKPMMVVMKTASIAVQHHDLRGQSEEAQAGYIAAALERDAKTALPISQAPVGRVHVFIKSEVARDYLWTTQKILVDGWSAIVVLGDVIERYRARREGGADQLAAVPRLQSYFSFLNAQDEAEAEKFWARYFDGFEKQSPAFRSGSGGANLSENLPLRTGIWAELERCATTLGVTPSAFVAAVWAVFQSVIGARDDVTFALSLSGRSFEMDGHDTLVGPFATTAPRRAKIDPNTAFSEVAKSLNRDGFQAQSHESLSPHKMFGGSKATRNVPMPDTLLTVETLPESDFAIDTDGGVSLVGFSSGISSGFPLTVVVLPGENAEIKYSTHELLDAQSAQRALAGLPDLLERIVDDPMMRISDLRAEFAHLKPKEAAHEGREGFASANTPMELAVAEIWKDVLGLDDFDMSRDFVSLGGRSFGAMQILTRIEDTFGKRVPLVDFIKAQTVPALAKLVSREVSGEVSWKTLVPFRTSGSKRPLLFVHLGQHPVTFLNPFFEMLDADQPFFAVQPVGVSGSEKPLETFEALAKLHLDEFLSVAPDGPVDVIGHCGGARLAVEVVRQLRARGREVINFIAIDTRPPGVKGGEGIYTATQAAANMAPAPYTPQRIGKAVYRRARRTLKSSWGALTNQEELNAQVQAELVERACYIADAAYRAEEFPDPVMVLHSHDSPERSSDWDSVANVSEHLTIDVGHYTMFFDPDVETLSREIMQRLADAD